MMSMPEEAATLLKKQKLRKVLLLQYPVSGEDLTRNYEKMFKESLKPEDHGCTSLESFLQKVQAEYKIWYISSVNRKLMLQPTRVRYKRY